MPSAGADRNLLFAVLALQTGLAGRDQLLAALRAWAADQARPLGELLVGQGMLTGEERQALEQLVERQLARQQQGPARSLAELPLTPELRAEMARLAGTEAQGSAAGPVAPLSASAALRYRVLRGHAEGGLGRVSLAIDEELKREVALKQLQQRHADDADSRARFLREAEITGRLEHPGIVPVYGLTSDEHGHPCYAMRFVRGDSLQEAVRRFHQADQAPRDPTERTLALRGLLRRFSDVCNAVAYAHSRGVIHRDLKPANVMLGDYGETLVVDWGLARVLVEDEAATQPHRAIRTELDGGLAATQQGQVVGTPAFMPPEQARGDNAHVGVASDVWALGATLYEVLTGQPPYRGSRDEVLALARAGQVRPARQVNARVPAALEAVCARAMMPRAEERYGSAKELAGEVERWLADEPVAAHRDPLGVKLRRWARRNRTLVASGVVLLLAGVVGLALGLAAVERERAETARQRDEARQNLARAVTAEGKAKENLERAEANLKLAKKAVDDTYGLVKNHRLFQQRRHREVRKLLLEKVLPYYNSFSFQRPDDRALAFEQATYLSAAADITHEIGRQSDAIRLYEQARDVYQKLSRDHPQVADYRARLALTHNNLGHLYDDTDQRARALHNFEEALKLRRALCAEQPEVPGHRADLARSCLSLGAYHHLRKRLALAHKALEEALTLCTALCQEHPRVADYHMDLARVYGTLGTLLRDMGKPAQALGRLHEARRIQLALCQAQPDVQGHRTDLARTYISLANEYREASRPAEALKYSERARDIFVALSRAHPEVTFYRAGLATALNCLARAQVQAGQPAEALASHQKAANILMELVQAQPEVADYRANLARNGNDLGVLVERMGRRAEAIAHHLKARDLLAALCESSHGAADYRITLAWVYNMLALLLADPDRPAESLRNCRQAHDILQALSNAYPEVPAYRAELAKTWYHFSFLQGKVRPDEARKCCLRAQALYRDLSKAHPEVADYRARLADTCSQLGRLEQAAGKPAAALASFEKARDLLLTLGKGRASALDRHRLADLYYHLGNLHNQAGRPREALANYLEARDILRPLSKDHRQGTLSRHTLAMTCARLGTLQFKARRPGEALENFETARDLLADLLIDKPGEDATQRRTTLANTCYFLGVLYALANRRGEAMKSYEKARDHFQVLTAEHPRGTDYRVSLAQACGSLGLLQSEQGKSAEARKNYEKAIALRRALLVEQPKSDHAISLAGTLCNLGHLDRNSATAHASLPHYDEAVRLLQAVLRDQPGNPTARRFLLNSISGRAAALGRLGRHREAAADWEQAARLERGPARSVLRMRQALALARGGDHVAATTLAEQFARVSLVRGPTTIDLVCIWALAAQAAARDASRPLPERDRRADRYAREALALLERARLAGQLTHPATLDTLKKDADLAFLRPRDDFRQFLSRLEADSKP